MHIQVSIQVHIKINYKSQIMGYFHLAASEELSSCSSKYVTSNKTHHVTIAQSWPSKFRPIVFFLPSSLIFSMKFHHNSWYSNLFPDKISLFPDGNYYNYSFPFLKPEGEAVARLPPLEPLQATMRILELILFERLLFQRSTLHRVGGKSILESESWNMDFDYKDLKRTFNLRSKPI